MACIHKMSDLHIRRIRWNIRGTVSSRKAGIKKYIFWMNMEHIESVICQCMPYKSMRFVLKQSLPRIFIYEIIFFMRRCWCNLKTFLLMSRFSSFKCKNIVCFSNNLFFLRNISERHKSAVFNKYCLFADINIKRFLFYEC